jgi:branched-chain amino acid transport system permease protein
MGSFLQYTVEGLTVGCFYALVALGYTIVYGIIRLINFAHGDLAMLGSFVGWIVLVPLGLHSLPLPAALLIAFVVPIVVVSALSVGIFEAVYKPLLKHTIWSLLIAALAVSLILRNSAQNIFGASYQAYPDVIPTRSIIVGSVTVSVVQLALLGASAALMGVLYVFTYRTVTGTAMRALAVDHDAARLMGINVHHLIRIAFLVGGALAAAAGVMLGLYYGQISFNLGFLIGLRAFTAAVVGGIGNIPGAMAGGLLIGLLGAYSTAYLSSRWQDVIVFSVLVAMLIVRPNGLFGERVAERM